MLTGKAKVFRLMYGQAHRQTQSDNNEPQGA